jgi:hypothetical protein
VELVVGASDRNVYAFESDGSNSAGWPQAVLNEVLTGPAVGDLDHDGGQEVVALTRDGKFYAWHANGTPLPNFYVNKGGSFFCGPALIDIDGDGDLEIAAGSFTDNRVYLIDYSGSDHAGWPITGTDKWYGSPSVGDVDNDGISELIYAGFDSSLHVWNGDGSEVTGFPVHLNGQVWSSVAVGDVNHDNHPEMAVVTNMGSIYLVNYDGTFAAGFPVDIGHTLKSAPVMADLNDDGNLDLVFGDNVGNIYAMNAAGAFLPGFPRPLGGSIVGSPVVGDITGDAQPDIIVGSTNDVIYGLDRNGVTLRNFPIPGEASGQIIASPALGEFDGDGHMEIAVPIKGLGHNLMVLDYKMDAQVGNLQWPNFGHDIHRSNDFDQVPYGVDEPAFHPDIFSLTQNYPNPFNASTVIKFSLRHDGETTLSIFDLLGRRVKLLSSGMLVAGNHAFIWNGTDDAGMIVTSGVYFYRLDSAESSQTRRMVLLK